MAAMNGLPHKLLITAGPTHEPIDPVRYLANRSSGKLGFELCRAASEAGHDVTLLLGPVPVVPKDLPARLFRYETVGDLGKLLEEHFPDCRTLVMASAVADYRLVGPSPTKLPRDGGVLTIRLEPTPDLVQQCAESKRPDQHIVGFALEQIDLLRASAREKLNRKQLDAIVANPLETMESDHIEAVVQFADGSTVKPESISVSKAEFGRWFVATVLRRLEQG